MRRETVKRPTFFLAGTMQASNPRVFLVDQSYRIQIRNILTCYYPNSNITCPLSLLAEKFLPYPRRGSTSQFSKQSLDNLNLDTLQFDRAEVIKTFRHLADRAANADVLIACLPGHQASMGTAIEMWNAYSNNRIVIAITNMSHNVAVQSTSTKIIATIDALRDLIDCGWLDEQLL